MSMTEVLNGRGRCSKLYQDGRTFQWGGGLAPLHYNVGGAFEEINMSPVAGGGLHTIQANGWNYVLNPATGYVGYGGLRGAAYLRFKLLRAGYLHYATRTWEDISGAPTYNTQRLSFNTEQRVFSDLAALNSESVVTWGNIWPGVSLRWRLHGDALKEEIIVTQARRAAMPAPSTDPTQTYFGFVFQLDANLPRVYKNNLLQDTAGDFDDSDGGLELRTAVGDVLGFLPTDYVYAGAGGHGSPVEAAPLRKRIYRDSDGNTYLFLGLLKSTLDSLQAGPLVFDPTVNEQVGASADDAHQGSGTNDAGRGYNPGSVISTTASPQSPGSHGTNDEYTLGARFTTVAVAQAATITSATFTLKAAATYNAGANVIRYHVSGQAADNPATFGGGAARLGTSQRTRTTADGGPWTQTSVTAETDYSVTVTSVIQEIVNRAGWASNNAMVIIVDTHADTTLGEWQDYYSYDGSTTKAPKLDITYSAGDDFPVQPSFFDILDPTQLRM